MDWASINKANEQIATTEIVGKKKDDRGNWVTVSNQYVEVKERVIAFRKVCPNGLITTEISIEGDWATCEALIYEEDNGKLLANGHARESLKKQFAVECAETSAIGRALGFCGFGISTSIASYEDVDKNEPIFDEYEVDSDKLVFKLKGLYTLEEQVKIMNMYQVTELKNIPTEKLKQYIADRDESKHQG